jgi:hypothetical protein
MSRHIVHTHRDQVPVRVEAGYDRPLRTLYVQVWEAPDRHHVWDQSVLYASHLDLHRDWSDVGSVAEVLDKLHIPVPDDLYDGLLEDQYQHHGNRLVHYPPVPLVAPAS